MEGEKLAQAFSGTTVRAVVLSACQSGKSASADLGASLTVRLLQTGLPHVLLKEWLPALRESPDQGLRARALNQSSSTCIYIGQYDEAKSFVEASLAIERSISDRAREGATLNNLSAMRFIKRAGMTTRP